MGDEDASVPVSDIDVSKAVPAEDLSLPVTDIEPKTTAIDIDEHTPSSGADIKDQDLVTVGVETKKLTKKEIKEKEKREKKEKERERKAQKEMEKLARKEEKEKLKASKKLEKEQKSIT